MLGFDTQLALARSWNDAATQWMGAWSDLTAGAISRAAEACAVASRPPRNEPIRPPATVNAGESWYRHPAPNPFSLSIFGLSFATPVSAAWMAPTGLMGAFQQPLRFWEAMFHVTRSAFGSSFMSPLLMLGLVPHWPGWPQPPIWERSPIPLPQAASLPAATRASFVSYRSDSGHAVTQVTFPNDVVAAIALPPVVANGFAAWSPAWSL